ncbi:50S ribosome-binding GTPase [Janibacter hoylei]|uniref:GTPase n=1 Tax=Janibacter hoylei TaxID=364298 RepID=UPI00223874A1|nr:GTPase [Janibacter hoylei]MCW4602010.1 50S ribosome-binding GTPase [Janibacter hoylei]
MTASTDKQLGHTLSELAEALRERGWYDLVEQVPVFEESDPIRIAFVGPYNAGKSSLIAALTRDLTIPRSGKPESSEARRYRWQDGVELVDLPGWFSGFTEHDNRANEDLRRNADLVAFVLTVELGNESIVGAFETVFGTLGFADRAVVVVNKSLSEDSDPEVVSDEISRRLGRHTSVPVLTTDAQSFIDTISGEFDFDDESMQILTESSGIEDLSGALDEMVAKHGVSARTIAQSRQGARVAVEAMARLVPDEDERATIEQLDEFEAAIADAKDRLKLLASAHLGRMESNISSIAEQVIDEPTMSSADLDRALATACQPATLLSEDAAKALTELTVAFGGVVIELDLGASPEMSSKIGSAHAQPQDEPRPLGKRVLDAMGIDARAVTDIVAKAGERVAKEGAGKDSVAYLLARKLQPNKVFKPHGRLKDAHKIQKGAQIFSKATFAAPAVAEISNWLKESSEQREADRWKEETRRLCAEAARDEVARVRAKFDEWQRTSLAPYEKQLQDGRAPLEAVASEREAARRLIAALQEHLVDGLT